MVFLRLLWHYDFWLSRKDLRTGAQAFGRPPCSFTLNRFYKPGDIWMDNEQKRDFRKCLLVSHSFSQGHIAVSSTFWMPLFDSYLQGSSFMSLNENQKCFNDIISWTSEQSKASFYLGKECWDIIEYKESILLPKPQPYVKLKKETNILWLNQIVLFLFVFFFLSGRQNDQRHYSLNHLNLLSYIKNYFHYFLKISLMTIWNTLIYAHKIPQFSLMDV